VLFHVVLALNVLWFGTGFVYFALMPRRAARLVTTREQREGGLYDILVGSVTFLGGMNLAFCVLALLVLVASREFPGPSQRAILAAVFALAHGTQFAVNVPIAVAERRTGASRWPVCRGTMLFIFVVDGVLMLANAATALVLL
jgi:hypothetical protein